MTLMYQEPSRTSSTSWAACPGSGRRAPSASPSTCSPPRRATSNGWLRR
jgi:hypothetical protein